MSNFAMGTILGKDFVQAQVHTLHSCCDVSMSACAKPFPEVVPIAKLHSLIVTLIKMHDENLPNCIIHVYYG